MLEKAVRSYISPADYALNLCITRHQGGIVHLCKGSFTSLLTVKNKYNDYTVKYKYEETYNIVIFDI